LEAYWGPKLAYAVATGEHLAFICVNLTKPINIPGKPSNLSFWGAGSSTSVPVESPDGKQKFPVK